MFRQFSRIVIELFEPICDCQGNRLSWRVEPHKKNDLTHFGLKIWCEACRVELIVSSDDFLATFSFKEKKRSRKTSDGPGNQAEHSFPPCAQFTKKDKIFLKFLRMPLSEDVGEGDQNSEKPKK